VIPITIRHVHDFGADRRHVGDELVRPEAWDALRTATTGPFGLPGDRPTFEAVASSRPDLAGRARAIDGWAQAVGIGRLASYGVGGASLEWLLWRARPERELVLSDYGPATVARLAAVLPELEVRQHDLRADPPLAADAHLLHRVDTELDTREWRELLERFAGERLLVVATDVIDLRRASWQLRIRLRHRHATRAGWQRNRAAFERLWSPTHRATALRVHDLHAWDLRPSA
jgi:hypothetical protein